jgi:hypothetical protein
MSDESNSFVNHQSFTTRGGKTFVFGGFNGSWLTDTFIMNLQNSNLDRKVPGKRPSPSMLDMQSLTFKNMTPMKLDGFTIPAEWSDRESSK